MTERRASKKRDPALLLGMGFDEALERFMQTKPGGVARRAWGGGAPENRRGRSRPAGLS